MINKTTILNKKEKREFYFNLLSKLIDTLIRKDKTSQKMREVVLDLPRKLHEKIKESARLENTTFSEKVVKIATVGMCKEIITKL